MTRADDYRRGRQAIRELTVGQPETARRPQVPRTSRPAERSADGTVRIRLEAERRGGFRLAALLATVAVIAALIAARGTWLPADPAQPAATVGTSIGAPGPTPPYDSLGMGAAIEFGDWGQAQDALGMRLMKPTLVPAGYRLSRLYSVPVAAAPGVETASLPSHLVALYRRDDGAAFTFLQYTFGSPDAPTLQSLETAHDAPARPSRSPAHMVEGMDGPEISAYRNLFISWIKDGMCYRLDGDPTPDELRFIESALVHVP
jgi:hypothetical protein